MAIHPLAGNLAPESALIDVPALERAYHAQPARSDRPAAARRLRHQRPPRARRSTTTFTESHILAITQAICDYRRSQGHRRPAVHGQGHARPFRPGAADGARGPGGRGRRDDPPARRRRDADAGHLARHPRLQLAAARPALADGIVITPSHNPPADGGFKYNPPHGGPADTDVTSWIEDRANSLLAGRQRRQSSACRLPAAISGRARRIEVDFVEPYVADLASVIDMEAIRAAGLKLGVDPLGGAAVHYWQPIADRLRSGHHRHQPGGRPDASGS